MLENFGIPPAHFISHWNLKYKKEGENLQKVFQI